MPSHADRVRRQYQSGDVQEQSPLTPRPDALAQPLSELSRFAGWLSKDQPSVAVRAGVHALSVAIDSGHDTSVLMVTLDKSLARLPSGEIRKMLRKALARIRVALPPTGLDVHDSEDL